MLKEELTMTADKTCLFCGLILHPSRSKRRGKSEEHIFAKWLVDHLAIRNTLITSLRLDVPSGGILDVRKHSVSAFVGGRICAECNNGWMSKLEEQVKPVLIRLIADPYELSNLSEDERHAVARWTLKTAGVLNRSSASGNSADSLGRLVPDEHLRIVRSGSIPNDVIVVGGRCPSNRIADALQDASWAFPNYSSALRREDQNLSYKIALSFHSLLLAVAHYPNPDYCYGVNERSYVILWKGTRGVVRTNNEVGEVSLGSNSLILGKFLLNIFVVSKTWLKMRENDLTTRLIVSP
jgi:hypothetical protein